MEEVKGTKCKLYVDDEFIGESEAITLDKSYEISDGISVDEITADGKIYKVGEITEIDGEQYMIDAIKIKDDKVFIDASRKMIAPMDSITFKVSI